MCSCCALSSHMMEQISDYLCMYKKHIFPIGFTTAEYIDSLQSFEICDSDIFLVTYAKSGTIWTQNIIISILEQDTDLPAYPNNSRQMPWLECGVGNEDYSVRPSPRLFTSHLTPTLLPSGLKNKRIIYVMRNPKDNVVSYYHFSYVYAGLETPKSFEDFLEKYLGSWFPLGIFWDHLNFFSLPCLILFLFQDLKAAIIKICKFLGKSISEAVVDQIVEKTTFKNMKNDPKANYQFLPKEIFKGQFLRKGKIGDWKNTFTVAQSERFDQILQERLGDMGLNYISQLNSALFI
uniref:Sulfotransferase n=1 Tax=Myripristis murdjan TaxID=586833 RepID=A0A667ZKJ3_9TELE